MGIARTVARWSSALRAASGVPKTSACLADGVASRRSFGDLPARLTHRLGTRVEIQLRRHDLTPEVVTWEAGTTAYRFGFDEALFDHPHARVLVERWLACLPLYASVTKVPAARGETCLALGDCGRGKGLSFCDFRPDARLVPDPVFLSHDGYRRHKAIFAEDLPVWEERQPRGFWRGQTSGWHDAQGRPAPSWRDLPRVQLCRAGVGAVGRDMLDVGLTGVVQIADAEAEREIEAEGLMAARVDWERFPAWRYQIDVDGNSNAWEGLFVKLCTGSPVLKLASGFGFRQWYYDRLKPWFNVVPVAADGSDLLDKVAWLRRHDGEARAIGRAARSLTREMTTDRELRMAGPTIVAALQEGI